MEFRQKESFQEQAQAQLRRKLFRPMPELQLLVRRLRLEQELPPQFPELFQKAWKFPERIQRRLLQVARFQRPQQFRLPQPVFLQLSFSPALPVSAAAFWRCPSGHPQIPERGPDESASANRRSTRSAPASARRIFVPPASLR